MSETFTPKIGDYVTSRWASDRVYLIVNDRPYTWSDPDTFSAKRAGFGNDLFPLHRSNLRPSTEVEILAAKLRGEL